MEIIIKGTKKNNGIFGLFAYGILQGIGVLSFITKLPVELSVFILILSLSAIIAAIVILKKPPLDFKIKVKDGKVLVYDANNPKDKRYLKKFVIDHISKMWVKQTRSGLDHEVATTEEVVYITYKNHREEFMDLAIPRGRIKGSEKQKLLQFLHSNVYPLGK